jgi:ABC-type dipeptide/oligopeptide/nickel transport system permease component
MLWLARRIGISIGLVWIVASIVFLAIRLIPGNPAELLLSQGGVAPDPAAVAELKSQLGLDRPILVQYRISMDGLLHGNLGNSLEDGTPVMSEVLARLPRTLELIAAAGLFALVIGVPAGTIAAIRGGGLFDRFASWLAGLALAVPVFVTGTVLILVFAQSLQWMPAGGYVPFLRDPVQHLVLLAMPAFTIGVGLAAAVLRMTRAAVLDVARRDHVRTARAKGLSSLRVLGRHVLRNAMMPVVTVFALQLGALLGGTVLVEYVFNWPGLSSLLVDAVNARDYTEVQGIVLVISVLFVALNLLIDILYAVLDPRVRHR